MIAVLGGSAGIGRELGLGLLNLGHAVRVIDADVDLARRGLVERALAEHGQKLDGVVLVHHDPLGLAPESLIELPELLWRRRCELPLKVTVSCLQAAHALFSGRGGRIVLVIPTIAMTGAAGMVPAATAAEGIRSLAKAAARAWGADGITVNCVAFDVEGASKLPAALPKTNVAAVVSLLLQEQAQTVTGMTLAADGGRWMPA